MAGVRIPRELPRRHAFGVRAARVAVARLTARIAVHG